jgi:hypothetical protein
MQNFENKKVANSYMGKNPSFSFRNWVFVYDRAGSSPTRACLNLHSCAEDEPKKAILDKVDNSMQNLAELK